MKPEHVNDKRSLNWVLLLPIMASITLIVGCTYQVMVYEVNRFVPLSDSLEGTDVTDSIFKRPAADASHMDDISRKLLEVFGDSYSGSIAGRQTIRIQTDVVQVEHLGTTVSTYNASSIWRIENTSKHSMILDTDRILMKTALQSREQSNLKTVGISLGDIRLQNDTVVHLRTPEAQDRIGERETQRHALTIPPNNAGTIYMAFDLQSINPAHMRLELTLRNADTGDDFAYRVSFVRKGRK